jgi:hypothetical protein
MHMKESPFYQQLFEEGQRNTRRTDILYVLGLRFGVKAVKEFEEAVNRVEDLEQLSELHKLAAICRRISRFRSAIEELGK